MNLLLRIFYDLIQKQITERVNKFQIFSVTIADETVNITNID